MSIRVDLTGYCDHPGCSNHVDGDCYVLCYDHAPKGREAYQGSAEPDLTAVREYVEHGLICGWDSQRMRYDSPGNWTDGQIAHFDGMMDALEILANIGVMK